MKYILITTSEVNKTEFHQFETLDETTEFINFHDFEWFVVFEVSKEVRYEKTYKPKNEDVP